MLRSATHVTSPSLRLAQRETRATTGKRVIAPAARAVLSCTGDQQVLGPFDGEIPSMRTRSSAFMVADASCSRVPGGNSK
jgi:hypothetical protein